MTRPLPTPAEIAVLEALVAQGEVLVARSRGGGPAHTVRLRHLDPEHGFLVVGASEGELPATALPRHASVDFEGIFGEWRVAFTATDPQAATHGGHAAIRLAFPEAVTTGRRRQHARASVPANAPLRLVAYSGAAPIFEATVSDVSRGGLGLQVGFEGASLHPGMVLAGCRLERDGAAGGAVDLEVRHTASVTLDDGRRAWRAGVRFVALSPEAARLVEALVEPTPGLGA